MNKVFLIGNLTRDPELSETESGIAVCRFSIAVSRSTKNADGTRITDFFNCTAWRQTAENVAKYCKKGNKLAVVGSVQIDSYEDKEGVKKQAVNVIASEVEFLTPKSEEQTNTQSKGKKPTLQAFEDDADTPF